MATALDNANAALLAATVNLAELEAAGPQAWVDYSADGESYQYRAAKTAALESIDKYMRVIQLLGGPFQLMTRAR